MSSTMTQCISLRVRGRRETLIVWDELVLGKKRICSLLHRYLLPCLKRKNQPGVWACHIRSLVGLNRCFATAVPVFTARRVRWFVTCFPQPPRPYIPFTDINSDCPTSRAHFGSFQKCYSWPEVRALLQHPRVTQLGNTTRCEYWR